MLPMLATALLLGAVPSIGAAAAQSTPEACAAIEDSGHRLLCYDGLYRVHEQPLPKAPANWITNESVSRIDDTKSVTLITNVLAPYRDDYGTERSPILALRCHENTTALMLMFDGDYMADSRYYGPVTLRVDDRPARDYDMDASTDHHALGLWRGGQSIPVIKTLLGAQRLLVRATPVNSSPVTLEFNIAGLDQVIAPLRQACGW